MNKILIAFSLVLSTLLLTNCASIVSGSQQELTIDSYPQDTDVYINGSPKGITPLTIKVGRDVTKQRIEIQKEGYQSSPVNLSTKVNPWFWGNIIIGGLLGSSTDSSTGANSAY